MKTMEKILPEVTLREIMDSNAYIVIYGNEKYLLGQNPDTKKYALMKDCSDEDSEEEMPYIALNPFSIRDKQFWPPFISRAIERYHLEESFGEIDEIGSLVLDELMANYCIQHFSEGENVRFLAYLESKSGPNSSRVLALRAMMDE